MEERITKANEGQVFTVKVGPSDQPRDYTVGPKCELNSGAWFCITHKAGAFRNQFEKDMHINRGRHQLVWVCMHHGPEVP